MALMNNSSFVGSLSIYLYCRALVALKNEHSRKSNKVQFENDDLLSIEQRFQS